MRAWMCALSGVLLAGKLTLLAGQFPVAPAMEPQPQLPPSQWVVATDDHVEQVADAALQNIASIASAGTQARVLVDRRWVLTPPFRVSVTFRFTHGPATVGLGLGLVPKVESGRTGTFFVAHANGTCVLERRVEGAIVSELAPTESARTGASDILTLTADVSNTEAVFAIGNTPILTVPILSVDTQGSPGVWLSNNAAQLETFEVTLPASAVGQ